MGNSITYKQDSKPKLATQNLMIKLNNVNENRIEDNYFMQPALRKNTPSSSQTINTIGNGIQNRFIQNSNSPKTAIELKGSYVKLLRPETASTIMRSGTTSAIIRPVTASTIMRSGTVSTLMRPGTASTIMGTGRAIINRPMTATSQMSGNFFGQSGRPLSAISKNLTQHFIPISTGSLINPIIKIKADLESSNINLQTSKSMSRLQSGESLFWKNTSKIEKSLI